MLIRELLVNTRSMGELWVTQNVWDRLRGMLFRRPLPPALLITPCDSVHGSWMTVALDVAFIDADGRVIRIARLRPWGMIWPVRRAKAVLEAPAGSFAAWPLRVGDVVAHA